MEPAEAVKTLESLAANDTFSNDLAQAFLMGATAIEYFQLPGPAVRFVAVRTRVMQGDQHVCSAISPNFAKRIARALNAIRANRRGQ
jgi:hypothetical protein